MALTYDKVINVISQPPDLRKDFEVSNLLPWFRKKSQLFGNLKTELLFDIIKNLQFISVDKDGIIIKQGDQGDCMYILLRGQVTIYILYAQKNDADAEDKANQPIVTAKGSEAIRQQLGTFVTNLGPGATFGEVALMNEDCPRTASIIANEDPTELIVIDRELYNRSVKNVLKKEFEDKANFIATNPYFQGWAPKYKKQLTMALQKETVPYEGVIARQSDALDCLYFVLSGEVKLTVDPQQHKVQFSKFLEQDELLLLNGEKVKQQQEEEDDDSVSATRDQRPNSAQPKYRKKTPKRQPQEVCLLGVNESIGDIEVLMDLDTYIQTATCTQKTDILVLEMKHYERLLVKRNPRTIESMKAGLELRLKSRLNKHTERNVPLYRSLIHRAADYNLQRQQQNEARNSTATQEKHPKHVKTIGETFDSFVPPQGALIDLYGPGTVFHRIRQREEAKVKKQERLGQVKNSSYGGFHGLTGVANGTPSSSSTRHPEPHLADTYRGQPVDRLTSDPVLTDLEKRMREWLVNEYGAQNANGHVTTTSSKHAQPRVAKLHRAPHMAEADKIKPGAKVVLRARGGGGGGGGGGGEHPSKDSSTYGAGDGADSDEEKGLVHHGSAWV